MRARLSGLSGHKTVLETVYNYEDYADQLNLSYMMTFTPKEFLESIYRVKSYRVTGNVQCVFYEGYSETYHVSLGNAAIAQNIDGTFPMTFNNKPPQIQQPVDWYSSHLYENYNPSYGNIGMIEYGDFYPGFSYNHQIINKNCIGSYTVAARNWNPRIQPLGDYGENANSFGWRFQSQINCPWNQISLKTYFDKNNNLYYSSPYLSGFVKFNISPFISNFTSSGIIFWGTSNSSILIDNFKTFYNYDKIGKFVYQNADGNLWEIPILSNWTPNKSQFPVLKCDLQLTVTETWQDSDF